MRSLYKVVSYRSFFYLSTGASELFGFICHKLFFFFLWFLVFTVIFGSSIDEFPKGEIVKIFIGNSSVLDKTQVQIEL